jgi:hypothetical protein
MGNYFVASGERIEKFDSKGHILMSQSIKSSGNIDAVFANTSFKVFLFHSEQQLISIFDNTLSSQNNTIGLEEYKIKQASIICPSNQSDKIWVFEQLNSTLHLLSTTKKGDFKTSNLTQLLGAKKIFKIEERENELFLFTDSGAVLVLDLYGTFVRDFNTKSTTKQACTMERGMTCFLTESGKLNVLNLEGDVRLVSEIKKAEDVIGIVRRGNDLYISTGNTFYIYKP